MSNKIKDAICTDTWDATENATSIVTWNATRDATWNAIDKEL